MGKNSMESFFTENEKLLISGLSETLDKSTLPNYLENFKDKKLYINKKKLDTVDESAFQNLKDLEHLYLNNNIIENIRLNVFTNLTGLKKLVLSYNCLTFIEDRLFEGLVNLEELEITNNPIKLIYSQAFSGLSKLKRLILAHNQLQNIFPDTFNNLSEVNLLVLSYNKIRSLHPDTFKDMSKLKTLNLIKNRLKSLPEALFKNTKELVQISLSLNKLTHLETEFFRKTVKLERLYAHSNQFEIIQKDLFKNTKNLKLLDLGFNRIESIEKDSFENLTSLEILDLSRNQIKSLDPDIFMHLTSLSELYLLKNYIENINSIKMNFMTSLKIIQLDFNQITSIDGNLFGENNSLLEIYCNTVYNMKELQENIIKIHKQEFLNSIDFICALKTPESLLNSREAYKKLDYISFFSNRYKLDLFCLVEETKQNVLIKFITEIIEWLLNDLGSHLKNFKPYFYEAEKVALKVLELIITIAKNLSISYNLCKSFAANNGIGLIFSIINSAVLKTEIPKLEERESKYEYKIVVNIYGYTLNILYNILNKMFKEFEKDLVEQKAFESLIKASIDFSTISDFCLKSYMNLAYLFVDKDVSQLVNVKQVIKELANYTGQCAAILSENKKLERCPICFESDDQIKTYQGNETIIIQINESYFYLVDFLNVMYNFAVSDEIKYEIYELNLMKNYLRIFIIKGNSLEKEHSLKLLWQLCYDSRVADHVKNDQELSDFIKNLVTTETNNKNLVRNGKGILWLSKGLSFKNQNNEKNTFSSGDKIDSKEPELADSKKETSSNEQHIMISYNSKSRPLCMSIKTELERRGHKVWIDVESIYGSSLESMASAIENSMCVLVCVTEKYKESNFCRLEAEYLIQQKKPFIPVIMQKGYKPDGWLGIILGSRIFVDFTKLEFNSAMNELFRNLDFLKISGENSTLSVAPTSLPVNTSEPIQNLIGNITNKPVVRKEPPELIWTEAQVETWLREKNINQTIIENLVPCNGQVLFQLYNMLSFNPEYFYGALKPISTNSLRDLKNVALFCCELKKVFDKKE